MTHPASSSGDKPAATSAPAWIKLTLAIAGVYNLLWGASVILAPTWQFSLLGVPPERWPNETGLAIWQCVGMVIGLYGLGYLIASRNPYRHWPIVLLGLLGKILGPIGFIDAAYVRNVMPAEFGYTLITNDLIWWVPFTIALWGAWKHHRA